MDLNEQYNRRDPPGIEYISEERPLNVVEVVAKIRLVNGEPVSSHITERVIGKVSISETLKMLKNGTLTSYKGDGIERPIETREEEYPRKERVRKSGRKKRIPL